MRSLFRCFVPVVLVALSAIGTANAQLGGFPGPQQAPPPAAAPSAPAAQPPAAPSPAPRAGERQEAPALTPEQVREIVDQRVGELREGLVEVIREQPAPMASPFSLSFTPLWFVIVVLAVAVVILRRRLFFTHNRLIQIIHDIVDPAIVNAAATTRKLIDNLASAVNVPREVVDPEGAKAEKVVALKAEITKLTEMKEAATREERFETAGKLKADIERLKAELAKLEPPAVRRKGEGPLKLMIAFVALAGASTTLSAQPTCWNIITGATPGSVKAAIAVVGSPNTFECSVAGKSVELVDDKGVVILTPTIKAAKPLSFEFTPASAGRAIIKVDGRVRNQMVIRSLNEAILVNDAVDLSAAARPTAANDPTARKAAASASAAAGKAQSTADTALQRAAEAKDFAQTEVASFRTELADVRQEIAAAKQAAIAEAASYTNNVASQVTGELRPRLLDVEQALVQDLPAAEETAARAMAVVRAHDLAFVRKGIFVQDKTLGQISPDPVVAPLRRSAAWCAVARRIPGSDRRGCNQ